MILEGWLKSVIASKVAIGRHRDRSRKLHPYTGSRTTLQTFEATPVEYFLQKGSNS